MSTQFYIGSKQIKGSPLPGVTGEPGYAVQYPDGYKSWSPKDTFESAYLPMGADSDGSTITQEMVDSFIAKTSVLSLGNKTTVVVATLANGFEMIESSSCADPANYDEALGAQLATERIKRRIWDLLGFLLQTARYGVKSWGSGDGR